MGVANAKKSGRATVAAMKRLPTDDDCFGRGRIREDGWKLHPAYLWEVKKPLEPKHPGDVYRLVGTAPAEQAFRPLNDGLCPFIEV